MNETDGHSCIVLHGDKAVCIPMNGMENSDELNDLVHSALLTITQSEELTQNYDWQLTVDPNAMCITHMASCQQLIIILKLQFNVTYFIHNLIIFNFYMPLMMI